MLSRSIFFITCVIPLIFFSRCSNISAKKAENNNDSLVYLKHAIGFIREVYGKPDTNFVLSSEVIAMPPDFVESLSDNKELFSKSERDYIREGNYPKITIWNKEDLPELNIISHDSLTALFRSKSGSWEFFYSHLGNGLNSLAYPIFLRSYTLCLQYIETRQGAGVGGYVVLYKWEKGKWVWENKLRKWIN